VLAQDAGFLCHVRIFSLGKFIRRVEGVRYSSNVGWNTIIPILINVQQDTTVFSLLYFWRQLCMFWLLTPIIRSLYKCNYSFWH